jgi:hypothetical protein
MSNKLDIELKQGEDFYRLLTIKNEDGTPVNLTGFTFSGMIKESFTSPVFLSFSFTVKDQVTNTGEVEMTLPASQSSKKPVSSKAKFVYDVEMNSGSQVTRILQGSLLIDPEVTK